MELADNYYDLARFTNDPDSETYKVLHQIKEYVRQFPRTQFIQTYKTKNFVNWADERKPYKCLFSLFLAKDLYCDWTSLEEINKAINLTLADIKVGNAGLILDEPNVKTYHINAIICATKVP